MDFSAELAKYAALLEAKGFLNGVEGNVSIFDRETGRLYITPSGMCKQLLTPGDIAVLDENGGQPGGPYPASSEYRLHLAAYRARPDIAAVVHSHAPALTACAVCGKALSMDYYPEFLMMFRDIPVLPFGMPGTEAISAGIEKLLSSRNVILLQNHGALAVGKTIGEAARLIEAAEACARVSLYVRQVGEPCSLPREAYEECAGSFERKLPKPHSL